MIRPGISGVIFIISVPSLEICELCSDRPPLLSTIIYVCLSLRNYCITTGKMQENYSGHSRTRDESENRGTRDDHSLRSLGRRTRQRRTNYFASERSGRPSETDILRAHGSFSGRSDFRWIMPTTRGCRAEAYRAYVEHRATPQLAVLGAKMALPLTDSRLSSLRPSQR